MAREPHFSLTSNLNLKYMKTNLRNLTIVGVATVMVAGSAQAASITRAAQVSKIAAEIEAGKTTPKRVNSFWRTAASSKSKSLVSVLPASVVKRRYPVTLPAAILPANKLKIAAVTVVTPPPTRGAASVPDGGTTAAMLGTTLAGLALLKKKNAFRTGSLPA